MEKAKLCPVDLPQTNPLPRVAIGLANGIAVVGWAAKGYGSEVFVPTVKARTFSLVANKHAEEALLRQLEDADLSGVTAYVTLEPCTVRNQLTPADYLV